MAQKLSYSTEEIKAAFWDKFHQSGESWFPYWEDQEEENTKVTNEHWQSFLSYLKVVKEKRRRNENLL